MIDHPNLIIVTVPTINFFVLLLFDTLWFRRRYLQGRSLC